MMLSPAEVVEYIHVMRREGALQLKLEGLEVTLNPQAQPQIMGGQTERPPHIGKDDYDRWQFAATEGIPDEESPQ